MGFLTGLITGASQSIDKQLQKDMLRTQERMDGMEQYRVTRRRARLEEQEKERKELGDVLKSLAAFTDGDEDKAIQLYKHAGSTIAGGMKLADTLRTNMEADVDVLSGIKFADAGDKQINFADFIDGSVTPVTPIANTGEQMRASGLYALFNPDVQATVDKNVEAAAPLPAIPEGMDTTRQATVDYSKFLSAEEAERKRGEFKLIQDRFKLDQDKFKALDKDTQQRLKIAVRAQTLAEQVAKSTADDRIAQRVQDDARIANEQARIAIAADNALNQRTFKTDLRNVTNQIIGLNREDFDTEQAYLAEKSRLATERQTILANISDVAIAQNAGEEKGVSDSIMRLTWLDAREQGRVRAGITDTMFVNAAGEPTAIAADASGYQAALDRADRASASSFVGVLQDADGSYGSSAMNIISTDGYLKKAYESSTGQKIETDTDEAAAEVTFDSPESIKNDPQGYLSTVITPNLPLNLDNQKSLLTNLVNAGVDEETAKTLVISAVETEYNSRQTEANRFADFTGFNTGETPVREGVEVAEDGTKTMDGITWNPAQKRSIPSLIRSPNTPAAVREVLLEDYVALMSKDNTDYNMEDAMKQFGLGE